MSYDILFARTLSEPFTEVVKGVPGQQTFVLNSLNGQAGFFISLSEKSEMAALEADLDQDGIPNEVEIERGTDPFLDDSDGDGTLDAADEFPTDPGRWKALLPDPNDHTPPVITLELPVDAKLIE
jgi:hypothetical protein